MSQQNNNVNRFALIGALAAVPIAGVAYFMARRNAGQKKSSATVAPALPRGVVIIAPASSPDTWTVAEVHQWLASVGSSDDVMNAFYRDGVDGITLPMLQDPHLEKMGIASISQRVKVLRAIRVLFNFPITDSVANTPQVSPTASMNARRVQQQQHQDPHQDAYVHAAAAVPEAAAITQREVHEAHDANEAQVHAVTTLASKMQRWYAMLTSDEFIALPLIEQRERVSHAARELAAIARLLQTLPPSPPVQELKALATQLMDVIGAANEAIEEAMARQLSDATAAAGAAASAPTTPQSLAAAEKVAELLLQFENVLTSPEMAKVGEQQKREMSRGIGDQLVKIRDNVVPALPENQRAAFMTKCNSLLEICVRFQSDARPMSVRQPGVAQGCCGGAAHEHDHAVELARGAASQTEAEEEQPQPASLNFIITRMRGVFEVIRSPQFLQEPDPEKFRAAIADAAKDVHCLTLESEHLPADQQEVVHQVAKNIVEVLSKMAQAVEQSRQSQRQTQAPSAAAATAVGQRPVVQQRGQQAAGQPVDSREVEIAQQMSRQLVAMLNVLKSEEFEAAPPLQRRALAQRMRNDLDVMGERLSAQVEQVQEMLEPTRLKLVEFVDAVLQMTAEPAEVTRAAPQQAASREPASAAAAHAGIDAAQQISKQLVAMLNVLKSEDFAEAAPEQKRQLAIRVKKDLETISQRLQSQPPKIRELLEPTRVKLEEFVTAVMSMTSPNASGAAEEEEEEAPPTTADVDLARGLSKQLVSMLGVLKSPEFDQAPMAEKRAVAVGMQRDLKQIAAAVAKQPKEIRDLVEPTRVKIANFVDAIIGMADEESSFKQPKPDSPQKAESPSAAARKRAAQQAAATQQQAKPGQPSQQLMLLMKQFNDVAKIITGTEFESAPASKKLDIVVQCQQLLGSLVQRVAALEGEEQQVAMRSATQLNQLLKSVADPILTSVDEAEGEDDGEDDREGETEAERVQRQGNDAALNVVQRTQQLFTAINSDSFLDAEPAELLRKAAAMKRELQEIAFTCANLDPEQRSSLIPVLRSLADILDKVENAAAVATKAGDRARAEADDEENDARRGEQDEAAEEDGQGDDGSEDPRRAQIFQIAKEMTAAINAGHFKVEDTASVEQLSTLLGLLDSCGVNDVTELQIREQYQNAVERSIGQLSRSLGVQESDEENEDDDNDEDEEDEEEDEVAPRSRVEELPDPPQPKKQVLRPVESSRVEEVDDNAEEDEEEEAEDEGDNDEENEDEDAETASDDVSAHLQTIIAKLNSATSAGELEQVVPILAQLSRSQAAGRDRRHLALISQAVSVLQRKRAEFARGPAVDLRGLKNTVRRIIISLRTATEEQVGGLMKELTTVTDTTDAWKQDQEATNLINAAIAEVSAAVKRIEAAKQKASSPAKSPENGASRTVALLTEAARRVREGRDPTTFLPIAVDISRRRAQLSPAEVEALEDFEQALAEFRDANVRANSTSDEELLTPPNTPASPAKPAQRQVPPAAKATKDQEAGDEEQADNEDEEAEEEEEEEEDHERTILDVIDKIKQRVSTADVKSFQDLAPFIAILQRLRQGPTATPRVDAAVTEVEDLLREKVAALKAQSTELRGEQVESKRRFITEMQRMLTHPRFGTLDPEARNQIMRKATAVLKGLDANEQQELHAETQQLFDALMAATEKEEEATEETPDDLAVGADLTVLPRIVERLGTVDFMESCSIFEIQAIARTLARLEEAEFAEVHEEFKSIVKHATKLLADRASSFTGTAKDPKNVSTPLNLTGMTSESEQGHAVVRYTLYSSEEEEAFTPNEQVVSRFALSPESEAHLPAANGVEAWRGKSVAILFVFEQSPLDAESINQTAQGEANHLAEVLEVDHGFDVIRVWGTPTPRSVSEAIAGVAGRDLKRLFIYVQNPAVKAQLPPVPEHAIIFEEGQVLKHASLLEMAKAHSEHTVVYHDNGSTVEVLCSFKGSDSAHLGASVTEAGFLVANSGRCWLYDGLFTPILLEALSIGNRTLCPEDLVNTAVRVLAVKDGGDGPYIKDSPSTARAFFAPGLGSD